MKLLSISRCRRKFLGLGHADAGHALIGWIFLRGLALIYLAAFASMSVQILGLIGSPGIMPLQSWLPELAKFYGDDKYWLFPTLFWFDASDLALKLACIAGMGAAVLLLLNIMDRAALLLCYVLYLSITVAGQDFTSFQWDIFLLEAGVLGVLQTFGSELMVFLYRFLLARFMFMGGLVKLASGDTSWAGLTALSYHYLTEPLPSPLAYYAYFLAPWFHQLCVAGVFFIELIVPFFVFLPPPFRLFAAWSFIALQSAIILTGNYNFFNLLTILLCLWLFDDKDVAKRVPARLAAAIQNKIPRPGLPAHALTGLWTGLVLMVCATSIWINAAREMPSEPFKSIVRLASSFALVSNYGPFAVMTVERKEIIVEGSNDGKSWRTYPFIYKPVELDQSLGWNIPHQPRLDWQMWFAALEPPPGPAWFERFMMKLKDGSPEVLSLLRSNPFPDKPPRQVRALLYRYEYNSPEQRAATGQIWRRVYLGVYWPYQ